MFLSDITIRQYLMEQKLKVVRNGEMYLPEISDVNLQPASIDLHLGDTIIYVEHSTNVTCTIDDQYQYRLDPGEFVLGHTIEHIEIPDDLAGFFANRSSIGRKGLFTENAGFVDPGWKGQLTVELFNSSRYPISLIEGMPIGQILFVKMDRPVALPYGHPARVSHYQNSVGTIPSRI